jgi:hypothetical protein
VANVSQRSFQFGELSPAFYARTDTQAYAQGLRTLRNAYVMRTGGVQNRPGTLYKGATKSNGAARLVSCVFSDSQNFVLEFGNLYVRFWKNGSPITATVSGAWADATVYTAGLVVSYSGVNYVCILGHTSATATNRPSTGSSWTTVWAALTGTTYELPTPYTSAQLAALQFARRPGVLTIVHPSHPPATLIRTSDNVWDLVDIDFTGDDVVPTNVAVSGTSGTGWGYAVAVWVNNGIQIRGKASAFERTNITSNNLDAFITVVQGAPRTVTWTGVSATDVQNEYGRAASIIGYSVYLSKDEQNSFVRRIDVFTEDGGTPPTTFVDDGAAWLTALGDNPVFGSITFGGSNEYPSVVGSYQQRTLYAATNNAPDTVFGSRVAAPNDFGIGDTIEDDDALSFRLVSQRTVVVRHLLEIAERFLCFTTAGEFILQGGSDGVLRPGEINPRQLSFNGASALEPLPVEDTALYVQGRGNQIRNLVPQNQDGYSGTELSRMSSHLVDRYTMSSWCYQEIPHSVIWMVRSDGTLISLTYERESGVVGWAKHDTVGGTFESICCVPEGQEDAVYVVVLRGSNRYIERFAPRAQYGAFNTPIPFMDCVIDVGITGANTLTGLTPLNGSNVSVVMDRLFNSDGTILASPNNPAYTTRTVSGGQVTVPGAEVGTTYLVGLPITTDIQTLDIDAVNTTVKERGMNIGGVIAWIEETGSFYAGPIVPTGNTLTGLERYTPQNSEGYDVTGPVTGVAEVTLQSTYNNSGRVLIRQVDPVPLTILSIAPTGFLNGGR